MTADKLGDLLDGIYPEPERSIVVTEVEHAGILQVDELLATKLRGSGIEHYVEVLASVQAEHEERLITVFRI